MVSKLVLEAVLFWAIVDSRFCVYGFDVDNVNKQDWGVMLTLGHQFRFRWDLPIFVSALYLHLVDLRRIKKVQLQRKSLFKLFSSWYFSIFPLTSSFCLVCTFASRCQQSTHPVLFFDPNISAFCFPLFYFCDYIPLVSSKLPVDPFFTDLRLSYFPFIWALFLTPSNSSAFPQVWLDALHTSPLLSTLLFSLSLFCYSSWHAVQRDRLFSLITCFILC